MKMTSIIDKLSKKYFQYTGTSPDFGFWSWLEAMGIQENEKALKSLYNDKKIWTDLKLEYEERH